MNTYRGFGLITVLIIIAGLCIVGGGAYVVTHPEKNVAPVTATSTETAHVQTAPGDHPEVDHAATDGIDTSVRSSNNVSVSWKFEGFDSNETIPHTKVTVIVNGTAHPLGEFVGTCHELGGTGSAQLLVGEIAGANCWWGGGGNEIGIFATEEGGHEVMVGELDEGTAETAGIRGNFKIRTDILL